MNTIALTFRAELYEGISHTLDPWAWPASSWGTSVWVLPDPVEVGVGSVLRAHYHRRIPGKPDGLTCELSQTESGNLPRWQLDSQSNLP